MIRYRPDDLLRKIAPPAKIKKLVSGKLTVNKAALAMFDDVPFLSKKSLEMTALKTVRQYKKRFGEEKKAGLSARDALEETLAGKELIVNRIQNSVINQISEEIKEAYYGEFYTWLPSYASEPDPEHQLNYGKTFRIGQGEMPGERYGCKCGMNIQVKESQLDL